MSYLTLHFTVVHRKVRGFDRTLFYWVIPEIIHIPPRPTDGKLEIQVGGGGGGGGGQEGLEIQVGGGYRLENSSSDVIFDRCIKD